MNITTRQIQMAGVCVLLALGVAACGSSQSNSPTNSPASTRVPAETRAPVQPTPAPLSPANVVTATPESAAPLAAPNSSKSESAPKLLTLPIFDKLNLNTARSEEYSHAIPGLGSNVVGVLVQHRPYTSIQQFRSELGKIVDAATVAQYEKYVYVPVDVNQSDAATLEQIPGVTPDIATALIAARPFADNDAFLANLSMQLAPNDVTLAQNYLTVN